MSSPQFSRKICFGEFELNLDTAELQSNGSKAVLPGQPFQVLLTLLDQPGQLVTREELKKRLWPSDTFVDFDQSLNKAVNRLREALADSAEHPHFIETLPRKGYRFIGIVQGEQPPTGSAFLPSLTSPPDKPSGEASHSPWFLDVRRTLRWAFPLLICAIGLGWFALRASIYMHFPQSHIRSLAVLPLENISGDPSQDSFADAATDQLITNLGRNGGVRVISRTSVMQYKGSHKSLPQIARELNVDAIVEGAVVRAGDEVRINIKLVHAATDTQLWAESYRGNVRNVLATQDAVANKIMEKVLRDLEVKERRLPGSNRYVDPEAFNDYVAGLSQSYTSDGLQNKIQYFSAAVEKQPDFAEGYAELASSYAELGHMLLAPPEETFPYAKVAALKAIALNDDLANAHSTLGEMYLLYDWDFAAAEREIQRAVELNPNRLFIYSDYAEIFLATGRYDQAMQQILRKESIDPVAAQQSSSRAGIFYFQRRYDEAIDHARRVLNANPNSYTAHLWLGLSLEQRHQFSAALPELEQAVKLSNDNQWIGFVAHDLAVSGHKDRARRILHQLQAKAKVTYVSPWWMAIIYAGLGEKERTLYWLNVAYQRREHDLVFSNCWPMFDNVRQDSGFRDLLHRIGLQDS
jgi:TolB-like protein/DNA-binding winged helix-turn-helix (wHTH) protein/Flp pilus assembly protein TadD